MKNILVIDTDSNTIDAVVSALNGNSEFNLHLSDNISKAYEIAVRNFPHLVICSHDFIEESEESFHMVRDKIVLATTPFIFLLNHSKKLKKGNKINYGFDFYIQKPFTKEELNKIVKLAIDKFDIVIKKTQEQLEELRGSISYSLPHEFFTPLNGILGFTDILIKDLENLSSAEIKDMLQFINKDAVRLKNLTENFIAFAELELIVKDPNRIEALRKTYFINPKDIISSVSAEIAKQHSRSDDLILELDDASIRITESYLKKVLAEIIGNAFKFSDNGQTVIVTLLSNDTGSMISISDCGRGMSLEEINSIGAYMQFKRKSHEQQGSGLGLVIAKKIVEIFGGEFTIESMPNEGSKFTLIFENKI